MTDNYGFNPGTSASARSKNPSGILHIPYVYAATGEPTVVGFENGIYSTSSAGYLPNMTTHWQNGATHALMTVDIGGGNIRFREDNVSPTSSIGLLIQAGFASEFIKLQNVKVIANTATTTINITYRKYDQ